jgi:hypothetical protein
MESNLNRLIAATSIAITAAVLIAGCANESSSSNSTSSTPASATLVESTRLDGVCDSTVAVQTDWFPQAEHGGLYELLGGEYTVDGVAGTTTGPLTFRGAATGVNLQIRAGGPFLNSPVVTEMFLDDSITLGYVGTDVAISRYAETPTLAVFNALDVNPQVILWNKALHPTAATITDIAKEVEAVSVYSFGPYVQYLVNAGIIDAKKVDANYKGDFALATRDIAHQGFATSEPYRYRTLESGAINTAYQLMHDAGWTSYPQNLAINKLRLEELRPCLTALVPIMQQAQIDFVGDPERTIATIVEVVTQLNTYWSQTPELARYAVDTMNQLGIIGNGTTTTFGDFESPRIDNFIALATPILREQGLTIPDVQASDLATNEFLDSAITQP